MRHTVSERRKRWFFLRSLVKSFWLHFDRRPRQLRAAALVRPLFAEALEDRVMFSASPVPVEPDQEMVDCAPVAHEAEMPEGEGGENDGGGDSPQGPVSDPTGLTEADVRAIAEAAKRRWMAAGISGVQLDALNSVTYQIDDLGGGHLGRANGLTITIDDDAAGSGAWFVDLTPLLDEEFDASGRAIGGGGAFSRYDLLSTLLHEQGHVIGLADLPGNGSNLMNSLLTQGLRRLPGVAQSDGAVPGSVLGDAFLTVSETEANDTRATAQALSPSSFSAESVSGITLSTTIPHVTILGTGDGTFDYYSFQVVAGARGIFDIDDNNFDTELFIFDSGGNLVASNDDSAESDHTGGTLPSFIDHTFSAGGTYTIGVGKFNSTASAGVITGAAPGIGDVYTLHVSVGAVISEIEPNNTRATAQVLAPTSFSTGSVAAITDSTTIPHLTILGTGNGTFDYYSFQALAGARGIFDIDDNNFDTELFIFDSGGNLIATNDDMEEPGHTGGTYPSYIDHTFVASGTYTIGIGKYDSTASGGAVTGTAPGGGDVYTLHVSLTSPPTTTVTVDGSGNLVVTDVLGGTSNDNLTIRIDGSNYRVTDVGNAIDQTVAVASVTGEIRFNTLGGDDTLTVDLSGGAINRNIVFNGGLQATAAGDALRIVGSGTQTAVYTPHVTITGNGSIALGAQTVTFSALEPVDFDNLASVSILLPGAADLLTVANGFDGVTGLLPAMVVSGSTGGVSIEAAHIRNVANVIIDTTGNDGSDTVTVTSANNAHGIGNLSILTGTGTDTMNVNGAVTMGGSITFTTGQINIANGADISSTGGGNITLTASAGGREALLNSGGDLATTGTGSITLVATGGDGNDEDAIVFSVNPVLISSGAGNISITGSVSVPSSSANHGVQMANTTITTGGSVSISGTGGNRTGQSNGIEITGASSISAGGAVSLNGTSGEGGITFDVTSGGPGIVTSNGNITITGNRADGTGSRHLIFLDDARVDTANGAVSITSTAPGGTGFGILISGRSDIEATGGIMLTTGNPGGGGILFDVTGAGNEITTSAGDILIQASALDSDGIRINSDQPVINVSTAGSGLITIAGTGGDGNDEQGIDIDNANLSTGSGAVTITGQVGASLSSADDGVLLNNVVIATTGTISVTGTGGNRPGISNGVELRGATNLASSGAGTVTVTGNSPNPGQTDILIAGTSTVSSASGVVTITGDEISLTSTAPKVVSASGNNLHVQPFNTAGTVGIGNAAAGSLLVDVAFLDKLEISDAHSLIIGRTTGTGGVDIRPVDRSAEGEDLAIFGGNISINQLNLGTNHLTLTSNTPGAITDALLTDITAASVTLTGTVTPGAVSGPGILVSTGNTTINNNLTIGIEGSSGGAGNANGWDQVSVSGNVTLGAASTLTVDDSAFDENEITLGDEFTIVNVVGAGDSVSGTFSNAPHNSIVHSNAAGGVVDFLIRYNRGTDGNDITLTAVNITTRVIDDGNNLVIEDIDDDTDDQITVQVVGANLVITESQPGILLDAQGVFNGAVGDFTGQVTIPLASFTGDVILRLRNGNDTVIFDGVDLTGTRGIVVEDGNGSDNVLFSGSSTDLANGAILVTAETITVGAAIGAGTHGAINFTTVNGGDISLSANVIANGMGMIELESDGDIHQTAGTIQTTGTGGVNLTAVNAITQSNGTTISSGASGVALDAGGNITIAAITTIGGVVVNTSGGAIFDGGDTATDVTAAGFAANAATGLGVSGNALETAVTNLEANGGTGGIFVANTGALSIGGVNGTLSGLDAGNAAISISATGGISTTEAIDATGGGITLTTDTVALGAAVASSGGSLVITPFTVSTTIGIGGGAGTLNLDDAELALLTDGFSSIRIGNIAAGTGAVDVDSSTFTDNVTIVGGSIAVTELNAGTNSATLTAGTGAITDGGDTGTDVTASAVSLNAGGLIGATTDAISVAATTLSTNSTLNGANGNQFLRESDTVTVTGFNAGTGVIELSAGEFDLTASNVVANATSIIIETGTTLDADGTDTFAGVTVRNGGILKGDGNLQTTPVTVLGGGTLTPGETLVAGGAGDLGTGSLTLNLSSVYAVNLNGTTPATLHDQLVVTGTVNLGNATLSLLPLGYVPVAGDTYVLINNDGADAVVGTFFGLLEGTYVSTALVGLPDQLFQISYVGGDGNDVVLTATAVTATTNVFIDGSGNLVVEDILGGATADNLSISRVGSDFVIEDLSGNPLGTLIPGATQTGLSRVVVPVSLVTGGVLVNTLDGADTINLDGFSGAASFGSYLLVNGGAGLDTINVTADLATTGADGGNQAIELRADTINVAVGADITTAVGTVELLADRNIVVRETASITTNNGDLTLSANASGTATGNFIGIQVGHNKDGGADLTINGSGDLTVNGRGGTTGVGNYGLFMTGSVGDFSNLNVAGGELSITGTGGSGVAEGVIIYRTDANRNGAGTLSIVGSGGYGVELNFDATFTSNGGSGIVIVGQAGAGVGTNVGVVTNRNVVLETDSGPISITGTGAGTGSSNMGVYLQATTVDAATTVTISGTGSATGTGSSNIGTSIISSTITAGDGNMGISGQAGTGTSLNSGVTFGSSTLLRNGAGTLTVNGTGNGTTTANYGVSIDNGSSLTSNGGSGMVITGQGGSGTSTNIGVTTNRNVILETDSGPISITGTGAGTGSGNSGVNLLAATVDAATTVTISGTGSATGTGSSNIGTSITSSTITAGDGNMSISGQAGTGTSLNSGVTFGSSTLLRNGAGTLTITGTGNGSSSSNHGVVIDYGSTLTSNGGSGMSVTGQAGAGTENNHGISTNRNVTLSTNLGGITMIGTGAGSGGANVGINLLSATFNSAGALSITGAGAQTAAGAAEGNNGVFVSATSLTATGALSITGNGGRGTTLNRGVMVTTSSLSGGSISMIGIANALTSGTDNAGIWMNFITLNSAGAFSIGGTGGGGTGMNHGIYMNLITNTGGGISTAGTAGSGATSLATAGDFFA